jgi:hypothetical protein
MWDEGLRGGGADLSTSAWWACYERVASPTGTCGLTPSSPGARIEFGLAIVTERRSLSDGGRNYSAVGDLVTETHRFAIPRARPESFNNEILLLSVSIKTSRFNLGCRNGNSITATLCPPLRSGFFARRSIGDFGRSSRTGRFSLLSNQTYSRFVDRRKPRPLGNLGFAAFTGPKEST